MLEPNHSSIELPPIPGKRYFTIGEVSELCGVKPHVLRYWEQEFPQLKPVKRRGNRRYHRRTHRRLYPMTDYHRIRELTREDVLKLLDDYYDERGWDIAEGTPGKKKLAELGLENL